MGKEEKLKATMAQNGEEMETHVVVNVYDLTPINRYTYWFGFGIFHTGIEVHGMEYGFGAHDYPVSGVFEVEPKSCPGFIYRCTIPVGCIKMPPLEFQTFIEGVASEYHGNMYHLITKNCNHFTDDLAYRLTGKRIPGWVNRLARAGTFCSCLLPESLQATTVKHSPEYHECLEDEAESSSTEGHCGHKEGEDPNEEKVIFLGPMAGNGDVAFIKELEEV